MHKKQNKKSVMLSLPKHLACGSNSIDWITTTREMLWQAQHDGLFLVTLVIRKTFSVNFAP